MIHEFELWAGSRYETNSLSDLSSSCLAIEADFFIFPILCLPPFQEPLLAALGGVPFAFRDHVAKQLAILQKHDIKPTFVFKGLDGRRKKNPFMLAGAISANNVHAWTLYDRHEATKAVSTFGTSGYPTRHRYYRLLQQVLQEHKIEFQVAPYNPHGQLAYLLKNAPEYIDAVACEDELLLYDVSQVITKIDFANEQFTFVRKQECIDALNLSHPGLFTDACLLAGVDPVPPLPSLPPTRGAKIRQVVDEIKSSLQQQPTMTVYNFIEKDQRNLDSYFLDPYRRKYFTVKNGVILTVNGEVKPINTDDVPNDLHDLIGQRLPDELYYYLSVGAVNTRILNQLTSTVIYEQCPPDGGESEVYRSLILDRLTPLRAEALALLAFRLHRAYHHRVIEVSAWYAPDRPVKINILEQADPLGPIQDWKIPENTFSSAAQFTDAATSLASTMNALNEPAFSAKSSDSDAMLQSSAEIKVNTICRFMYFRDYLDKDLNLTPWGKALAAMMTSLPPGSKYEEAAILAAELLKLDLLSASNMFPSYTGAPMHGSETDRSNTLLLARVSCLAKLHHEAIGFTGPLSRHLLAYGMVVDAVRTSVRDVVEMSMVSLLFSGYVKRLRGDLAGISLALPFLLPLDCAMGIAMKHYLDDVNNAAAASNNGVVTAEMRDGAKARGPELLFPHVVDYSKDLDAAFKLWDAVYAGVLVACDHKLLPGKNDKAYWQGVNTWVEQRR